MGQDNPKTHSTSMGQPPLEVFTDVLRMNHAKTTEVRKKNTQRTRKAMCAIIY